MPQETAAQIQAQITSLRSEIEHQKVKVKSSLHDSDATALAVQTLRGLIVQLGALERKQGGKI